MEAKLKTFAKEWVELDDVSRQIRSELRALNQRRKEVTDELVRIMGTLELGRLKIGSGGSIRFTASSSFVPVNRDHVFGVLSRELGNEILAEDLTDKIFKTMRPRIEKPVLKRDLKR